MPRRKTPTDYYNECKVLGIDLPLEDYKNSKTKIKHKCPKGHIYEQAPDKHLRGHKCPICYGSFKKTTTEYCNECKIKGYDLPVECYVNNKTKIKHKCTRCKNIYEQAPRDHLQGKGCPKCVSYRISKYKTKRPFQYLTECKIKGYDPPIEDYIDVKTKIKHKCTNCGYKYFQRPNDHLNGQGCPKCGNNKIGTKLRKTNDDYLKNCKRLRIDLPIEPYKDSKTKIKHKCKKGHIYSQAPNYHLSGCGCPICNESHGEIFIRTYLDSRGISYEAQKTFPDLKDKTYLSYDFYLPKYNILIEYQGIQHYQENKYFGGEESFKKQQLHDKMKKDYAKNNGYKLLELHYSLNTQEKINNYLKTKIK